MPKRVPKKAPGPVLAWSRFFKRACKSKYVFLNNSDNDIALKLAAHLALVGDTSDKEGQKLFWAFTTLFIHKKRKSRWSQVVEILPADEKILRIKDCCLAYHNKNRELKKTDKFLPDLDKANINLHKVVKTMLNCSDADALIEFALSKNKYHPSYIFEDTTLQGASKLYRGALSEGRDEFMEEIRTSKVEEIDL